MPPGNITVERVLLIVSTIANVVLAIVAMRQPLSTKNQEIKAYLGHAPYGTSSATEVDQEWTTFSEKVNDFFGLIENPHITIHYWRPSENDVTIREKKYDALFKALKDSQVTFGSMSTVNALSLRANERGGFKASDFQIIGYKRQIFDLPGSPALPLPRDYYRSGFAIPKAWSTLLTGDSLAALMSQLKQDSSWRVYLSDVEESGSSYTVPLITLAEQGLTIHVLQSRAMLGKYQKAPAEGERNKLVVLMNEAIDNKSKACFAMSDEDFFNRLQNVTRDQFCFVPISVPIPYDPIIVDVRHWSDQPAKNLILAGLSRSGFQMLRDAVGFDKLGTRYERFADYIGSGIVSGCNQSGTFEVSLPIHDVRQLQQRLKATATKRLNVLVCSGNDLLIGGSSRSLTGQLVFVNDMQAKLELSQMQGHSQRGIIGMHVSVVPPH